MNIQSRIQIDAIGCEDNLPLLDPAVTDKADFTVQVQFSCPLLTVQAVAVASEHFTPYPLVCDSNSSLSSYSADDCRYTDDDDGGDDDRRSVEYFSFDAATTSSSGDRQQESSSMSYSNKNTKRYAKSRTQQHSYSKLGDVTWLHHAAVKREIYARRTFDDEGQLIEGTEIMEGGRSKHHALSSIEMVEISLSLRDCSLHYNDDTSNGDDCTSTGTGEETSRRLMGSDAVVTPTAEGQQQQQKRSAAGRGSSTIFLIFDEVKEVASCLSCYR
jgi:hypothetical protein